MRFSCSERRTLSGATLALRVLEFSALLPPLYVLSAVGYPALFRSGGLLAFLCRLGCALLPRLWLYGLSWLYKLTASEILFCFAVLIPALLLSLGADALLRRRLPDARYARIAFAALLAAELILHLLPIRINRIFGTAAEIGAIVVLAVCLALTLADLLSDRAKKKEL